MDIKDKICESIASVLSVDPGNVKKMSGDETLNVIGMDSLNCVDIVVNIEEEFGVCFNDDDLLLQNINTIDKIKEIVERKLQENA